MTDADELQAMRTATQQVVHDVNNALAPVVGFAELLLEDGDLFKDSERVKRYVGLMLEGAEDALDKVASLRPYYTRGA